MRNSTQENSFLASYFRSGLTKNEIKDKDIGGNLQINRLREKSKKLLKLDIEKFNKNNLNLQQKIDRKYNNKDNIFTKESDDKDIFSKMKDSLIMINKTSSQNLKSTHTPEKSRSVDCSILNNDVKNSNNQKVNNESTTNLDRLSDNMLIGPRTSIPVFNHINIINNLRPQMAIYSLPIYQGQIQNKIIPQQLITYPQMIAPSMTPYYITPIVNTNQNTNNCKTNLLMQTNYNSLMVNNQIRYGAFNYPGLIPTQQIFLGNPYQINPYLMNTNSNQSHKTTNLSQNSKNLVTNQYNINTIENNKPATEKVEIIKEIPLIKHSTSQELSENMIKKSILDKRLVLDEKTKDQAIIKLPKMENLPPLPKESTLKENPIEYLKQKTENDYKKLKSSPVIHNVTKQNPHIDIIISDNEPEWKETTKINVKNIPVKIKSISSSSSSSSSSSNSSNSDEGPHSLRNKISSSRSNSSSSNILRKKKKRKSNKSKSRYSSRNHRSKLLK